ncbi:MAG TPA: hypothetical protein VLC95_04255 [Anaerolineae bacterium]|nr:hypothetical protein [Anaerolineae bacterium]
MAISVYDWQGNLQPLSYLKEKYGDFYIKEAGEGLAYRIISLRETVNTAATLIVRVLDREGQPIDSERVAWYWPDAPDDPLAGPQNGVLPQMNPNRAVHGLTNMNGDVGFGMGRGAYYWPDQDQIGPHAAWIYGTGTRSDVILGLGMIGATNHDHFNVEYALVDPGTTPPPPAELPTEEILAELAKIEAAIGTIRALLG